MFWEGVYVYSNPNVKKWDGNIIIETSASESTLIPKDLPSMLYQLTCIIIIILYDMKFNQPEGLVTQI